jgi:hypothetical protein
MNRERQLGELRPWGLRYPNWRDGFSLGLVGPPVELPAATR